MKIGILGAAGRMGRAIADAAPAMGADLAGGVDRDGAVFGPYRDTAELAVGTDVLIDFSTAEALAAHLDIARVDGGAIVVGTTGLTAEHHRLIDIAAQDVAVLQSANMSLGVNLLAALVEQAAARLGPDWDIEVLEMHHRHKLDAPSGTALLLGQAAAKGRGVTLSPPQHDRNGARSEGAIGFASLRGGSVAGDHLVVLATEGERIELGHRAETRAIFARGAIRAAQWLAGRPAGRYAMADVLGL
ncbi:4-hydroxy-tetrahydrodipicolinate reductase [Sphingomonas sp. ID1715]|uniref:4-hydroxy-tetrahydrodipicolinate reductase n=1 Tax=Sphingomonas sp. ID1715 TaxID=1656898 RepID=UPI00148A02FD|nr:4-hydroxy-tetrahydrodipicolinate reductase [Sphingomonas sp. ID1715]NNM77874.1 4-hydroxy-tetrahydrodipicolinate reductase [Sphingomonas sp. ID1715]